MNSLSKKIQVPLTFDPHSVERFRESVAVATRDPHIRVLVLFGHQEAFCRGMDLNYLSQETSLEEIEKTIASFAAVAKLLISCDKVIISQVVGSTVGGGLIFLGVSDFVIANKDSTFSLPEGTFGLPPVYVSAFLKNRLRVVDIKRLAFTSQSIDSETALHLGLIDEITAQESLDERLDYWVRSYTKVKQSVVEAVNKILNEEEGYLTNTLNQCCSIFKENINSNTLDKLKTYMRLIKEWE